MELFHEIPKRELLRQFYMITQGPNETVPQFVLCFQDLYRQLAQDVSVNHLKDMFLVGLRDPLRTTLALVDFSQQTIEQVVVRVLALVRTHHNNSFAMVRCKLLYQRRRKRNSNMHSSARYALVQDTPPLSVLHDHIAPSAIHGPIQ